MAKREAKSKQLSKNKLIIGVGDNEYSLVHYVTAPQPKVKNCTLLAGKDFTKSKLKSFVNSDNLKKADTTIILSPHEYRLLTIDAPNVPDEELTQASKWLVKDLIRYKIDEVVIDTFEVPVRAGQNRQLYVVIVAIERLQQIRALCDMSKLNLNTITIAEMGLLPLMPVDDAPQALIYNGVNGLRLMVVRQGVIELIRHVKIKIKEQNVQEEQYDKVVLEVHRSFEYYQAQMGSEVSQLFYIPSLVFPEDLIRYFSQQLRVPVSELKDANLALDLGDQRWNDYAMVFGLIEASMRMNQQQSGDVDATKD